MLLNLSVQLTLQKRIAILSKHAWTSLVLQLITDLFVIDIDL